MPKAHKYWTKKPKASHWGPSQKSGLSPGSSGNTYPSAAAATAPSSKEPTAPPSILLNLLSSKSLRCWFSSWSLVVVLLLLFLPSSLPVLEENFLAETMWRVVVVVLVESGKRRWRLMGRLVKECLVGLLQRIPPLLLPQPTPPPLAMVRAIVEWVMRGLWRVLLAVSGDKVSENQDMYLCFCSIIGPSCFGPIFVRKSSY